MSVDGVCLLVSESIRRLQTEGWHVELPEDGLRLANGKLTRLITYRDSLTSLLDRGDTDDAVWTLRRAKSARIRPTSLTRPRTRRSVPSQPGADRPSSDARSRARPGAEGHGPPLAPLALRWSMFAPAARRER
ncbi:hypothetical protein ACFW9F_26760 [Streptomyces sp. NPDC059506]|uniref:hypothetical protein n=1 Tax=Streptomyces sp. NPDC059506 TaxID=3347751 RepID=UPI003675FA7D